MLLQDLECSLSYVDRLPAKHPKKLKKVTGARYRVFFHMRVCLSPFLCIFTLQEQRARVIPADS